MSDPFHALYDGLPHALNGDVSQSARMRPAGNPVVRYESQPPGGGINWQPDRRGQDQPDRPEADELPEASEPPAEDDATGYRRVPSATGSVFVGRDVAENMSDLAMGL